MPRLIQPRLESFARLTAGGWSPVLAARHAGYEALTHRGADSRAAAGDVAAYIADLRAPGATSTARRDERFKADRPANPWSPAPDLHPILTEDEWSAEFAPHRLHKYG